MAHPPKPQWPPAEPNQTGGSGPLDTRALWAEVTRIRGQVQMLLNELKSGDTNQVLAKASANDYDFSWVNATAGPDAPTAADLTSVDLGHSAIAAGTSLYDHYTQTADDLNKVGLGHDAIMAGTSFYDIVLGAGTASLLSRLDNASGSAVCNEDGTITITITI